MIRAIVLYEGDVDPERYQQHIEQFVRPDPGDLPPRQGVRRTAGDGAALPLLRGVRVSGHGRVHAGRELAGVRRLGAGCGGDGHPVQRPLREHRVSSIVYEKSGPRATITFNRPEVLNAFDHEMLLELAEACEQAANDDDVRVVVLTGAGRAFCVGANLRAWADEGLVGNEREYWKWFRAMDRGVTAIREIGKPTVARINGICVGGGNEMQMACDLAVMVDDAYIRHVGLQHGSVPAAGATQWLPILVGDRRAREIILLCEEIPAQKAEEWGLVNRAVPAAELDATVDDFVAKLARPAAAHDPLRQSAARLLPRPRLARHNSACARLARVVDAQ